VFIRNAGRDARKIVAIAAIRSHRRDAVIARRRLIRKRDAIGSKIPTKTRSVLNERDRIDGGSIRAVERTGRRCSCLRRYAERRSRKRCRNRDRAQESEIASHRASLSMHWDHPSATSGSGSGSNEDKRPDWDRGWDWDSDVR
jgi:hypothetical protein